MRQLRQFTAIIEYDDGMYVALCPGLDVASQGETVKEARSNLVEAIELLLEVAPSDELERRTSLLQSS